MTIPSSDLSVYTDFQGLNQLQGEAKTDPKGALRKAAQQFEAVFIDMMLKSMREANMSNGMFDSDQMKTYQEMFDQQISLSMSDQNSMGIADLLVKQLGGVVGTSTASSANASAGSKAAAKPQLQPQQGTSVSGAGAKPFPNKQAFLETIWPYAQKSAAQLGVDPTVLAAQAALESNWGNGVSAYPDGRSSHNLFGIKADAGWSGPRVNVPTLEYKGGEMVKQVAPFRAYGSYAESFADYTRFLQANPRYQNALASAANAGEFITGLQQAGYATDPNYADKVQSIVSRPAFAQSVMEFKKS